MICQYNLDAEYGLLTIQSQSYSSTDWSTNACKLSTLMYLQITILFLTVTSAYEYCAWCLIMWYHVIRTINKPVYSSIIVQLYMYIPECASDLDVDYVLLWGLIVKGCSTFWSSCSDMEGFESFQVKYTYLSHECFLFATVLLQIAEQSTQKQLNNSDEAINGDFWLKQI